MIIPEYADNFTKIPLKINSKKPIVRWDGIEKEDYPTSSFLDHEGNWAWKNGSLSDNTIVIDFDCRLNKKDKIKIILDYDTKIIETPNGFHVYFKIKDGMLNRKINKNAGYRKNGNFVGVNKTKHFEFLKGIDVLGEGGYTVGENSIVPFGEYAIYNNSPIKVITLEELDKIIQSKLNKSSMRKGFTDILNGKIDIEEICIEADQPEHLYWKGLFAEARYNGGIEPEELYKGMAKKVDAFDQEECERQLSYDYHNIKPLTTETYNKLFPSQQIIKTEKKKDIDIINLIDDLSEVSPIEDIIDILEKIVIKRERPMIVEKYIDKIKEKTGQSKTVMKKEMERLQKINAYKDISDKLLKHFDIITISDSEQMMVKQGNKYTTDTRFVRKMLTEEISKIKGSYRPTKADIFAYLKDLTVIDREDLCHDKFIINFKNGYYAVDKNEFIPIKSEKYINKYFFYEIPYNFISGNDDQCPIFKKTLNDWLDGNKKITLDDIFEFIGYTLSLDVSQNVAYMIYGRTHTGKTTFTNILESLVGIKNRCQISLARMNKNEFGTHGMEGRILNMVGDLSDTFIKDTGTFKMLTGDDKYIPAEIKGGKQYSFRNTIKNWFNSNFIPRIRNLDDDAFFDRWILILFDNQFTYQKQNRINNLDEIIIQQESQGIYNEAIKGLRRLYERGHFRLGLREDSKITWNYLSNSVYAFIHDNCVRENGGIISIEEANDMVNMIEFERSGRILSSKFLVNEFARNRVSKGRIHIGEERKFFYTGLKWKDESKNIYREDRQKGLDEFYDN